MRSYLLLPLFLLLTLQLGAQRPLVLGDSAQISLMTVSPGPFLYSTFGHSAIRVNDPGQHFDRCFNYGTFDFEQPNFVLKFCQGRLLYSLDMETYRSFVTGNLQDNRYMQEQILNLSADQKQKLVDLLRENYKEENRHYKYDFFYDNCATRIRDIIGKTIDGNIAFDSSRLQQGQTMRQLLQPYIAPKPWLQFGINLILGQAADRRAFAADYMFLPDYVHRMFGSTKINDSTLLVKSERRIPETAGLNPDSPAPAPLYEQPFLLMCFVAGIGFLCLFFPKAERIFDGFFWFTLGMAGLIIFLLWFATDHSATKLNWNILWALPTHLAFFWQKRGVKTWVEKYFLVAGILAALAVLLWAFIPQEMPMAALPIAVLVAVKGLGRVFLKRRN